MDTSFGQPGRIQGFDHFDAARKDKEARRTWNAVRDLLAKPRSEFPAVEVRFGGCEVPAHIVDAAFTAARMARRAAGSPPGYDWMAALAAAMPAAIEADRQRRLRMEPMPTLMHDGARQVGELARDGIPRELVAPLILEMQTVAF